MAAMNRLIVVLLSWVPMALANEPCPPNPNPVPAIQSLMNVVPKLNTCSPSYKQEYEKLFSAKEPKESRNILHQSLTGTKFQLDVLDRVLGIDRDQPETMQPFTTEWAAAVQSCKDAFCALSKLFKNEESAYRVLNIAKNTGYVISLDKSSKYGKPQSQIWTLNEIQGVEKALKLLPSEFYHLKKLRNLKLASDNDFYCARANAYFDTSDAIAFCPGARVSNVGITYTAIHEIGHAYDFSAGQDDKQFHSTSGFSDISGWKPGALVGDGSSGVRENEAYSDASSFITNYAMTNPFEDFAESIANYVTSPRALAAVSSKKYGLIKKEIFKGREYLNPPLRADFEKTLGVNELINKAIPVCLSKLKKITFDQGEYSVDRAEPRELIQKEGNCSVELKPLIQAKLDRLSPYERCKLGDLEDIQSYVNQRSDSVLTGELSALFSMTPKNEARFTAAYKDGCVSKKDFTAKCYFQTLAKTSPNAFGRWKNSKATQKQMFEDLSRVTAQTYAVGGPQAQVFERFASDMKLPWSKGQMYLGCLQAVQEISFPPPVVNAPGAPIMPAPPPGYYIPFVSVRGGTSSQAKLADYCSDEMKKKASNQGYRFDNNGAFEKFALKQTIDVKPGTKFQPFGSIDDEVFRVVEQKSRQCASLPTDKIAACRIELLSDSLTSWAKNEAIDPADFVSQSFLSELSSKIRWQ